MLKRLFKYLSPAMPGTKHTIIPRERHHLSHRQVSRAALKTMERLQDDGYQAYLVGGGVRDSLLGGKPKDFDVATDATPEQVRRLFRNSRIIGRRFKIVHVRFGREIIEVTTFRAGHDAKADTQRAKQSQEGMLLRDNVFGDMRSDALRRDFTVNALYYTGEDDSIHDYTGGMQDLKNHKLRMIGDPKTRYQEDPVRMLRAVRFAAKLDFEIESKTAAPIRKMAPLLRNIPAARLFDEMLKLFMSGQAEDTFHELREYDLLEQLVPAAEEAIRAGDEKVLALFEQAMINTDTRIHNEQRVTPAFIVATFLWPAVVAEQQRVEQEGEAPARAHNLAAHEVISRQIQHTAIPKRFTQSAREIWELQARLPMRSGKRAERLVEHPRFRAAYDFLLMREQAGEDHQGLGKWWTTYQQKDEAGRQEMVDKLQRSSPGRKPNRNRRRRGPSKAPQES